ncbi:polysaccharide pyruvyl transferase family protein [Niveispirillum fermenti]|uniref:polysaccharide pyruvyl transferase family protein n=1 Tax=Niveispirillum fermenti TaxID=1233113 RepID=UPI003A8570E6
MTIALVHFNHIESRNHTTWPDMRTSKWKPNYGDMLVCIAILHELKLEKTVRVNFGDTLSQPVDRAIIRGSTYLHKHFDFEAANKTLDSIDASLAIVGLGAQNPTKDVTYLDSNVGAREFIARLNEKSASISVRGDFTASVVERLGGRNIRVTGCPSLFYTLRAPQVRVPDMLAMPERSIGVSIHSGLTTNIFCHAPTEALTMHGKVIAWALENAANMSVFEQGVLREYDIADHDLSFAERREAAAEVIGRMRATELFSPERLMAHMVSVKSIEEWLAKARDLDAIVGFRFHGNMVALLQGKPCYYYVYDSRLTEFCEVYGLPYQGVTEDWCDPAQAMIEHDWIEANKKIKTCFEELKSFYVENSFISTL